MSALTTSVVNPIKNPVLKAGFFFTLALFLVASCTNPDNEKNKKDSFEHYSGEAQGTTFSITVNDSARHDLTSAIDSVFRIMDLTFSTYVDSSLVSKINAGKNVKLNEHFIYLFNYSRNLSEITGGTFDITVGPLVKYWGFGPENSDKPGGSPDSLLKITGYKLISITGDSIKREVPGVQIDFNAIAQGYTVDILSDMIHSYGISDFMVEVGGEVKTSGKNKEGTKWKIGIDKPKEGDRELSLIASLSGQALATSGNYRKFREVDGKKVGHSINPLTGMPAENGLLSASVISENAAKADALATAFMVSGFDGTINLLKHPELEGTQVYLIYSDPTGAIKEYTSTGFPVHNPK